MNKYIYIIYTTLFFFIFASTEKAEATYNSTKFTVVIDPGHGGNDPGAIGRKGKEKNINLTVALKLGNLIARNCKDTRVIFTRKTDVFIPLHRRAEIANNAKADLFISIHTNSLANRRSTVSGTETYTLGLHRTKENLEVAKKENAVILIEDNYQQQYAGFNPNSSESYIIFEFMQDQNLSQSVNLASAIQKEFKNSNRIDRGVHQAGFLVLRATSMPSVLIELGYISNQAEEQYLLSEKGSTTLAQSIYRAFLSYKELGQTGKSNNGNHKSVITASRENKYIDSPKQETKDTNKSKGLDLNKNRAVQSDHSLRNSTRSESPDALTPNKENPIFKIQILTSTKRLPINGRQFKGLKPVEYYVENGIYKYTYGSSTDYNLIKRLKRTQTDHRFKDAFIIAFKRGKKTNVHQAIEEFKRNRK